MSLDLNVVWFGLIGMLLAGYALLDGFDLGVGMLHLFGRTDEDRRIQLNAIGPVWDGNEVWLVTGGGALFAAFPTVYATVFSGFYPIFMVLLAALIFRAVAIEFRSKLPGRLWRRLWDVSFSLSSFLGSLVIGIALGNIAHGVPLDARYEYAGTLANLLNPYAVLVGILTVALFAMHGAIYLLMKTEGAIHKRMRKLSIYPVIAFMICYVVTTAATFIYMPHMSRPFMAYPFLLILPIINILVIAKIPQDIVQGRDLRAFLCSCCATGLLLLIFGVGIFPNIVLSVPFPEHSLTIYNAASSQKTLSLMLMVALLGMPLVLAYTISIYWIFRGKVKLDETSY